MVKIHVVKENNKNYDIITTVILATTNKQLADVTARKTMDGKDTGSVELETWDKDKLVQIKYDFTNRFDAEVIFDMYSPDSEHFASDKLSAVINKILDKYQDEPILIPEIDEDIITYIKDYDYKFNYRIVSKEEACDIIKRDGKHLVLCDYWSSLYFKPPMSKQDLPW